MDWWVSLDQSLLATTDTRGFHDQVTVLVGDERLTQPRSVVIKGGIPERRAWRCAPVSPRFTLDLTDGAQLRGLRVERVRKGRNEAVLVSNYEVVPTDRRERMPMTLLNPCLQGRPHCWTDYTGQQQGAHPVGGFPGERRHHMEALSIVVRIWL